MGTVALIQARMGSTRLPGKVLMDIGGLTMLERVVRRVNRSSLVDVTLVVTSTEVKDDVIAETCSKTGTRFFRGSEEDVLERYYRAALAHGAEVIVRITADCPFIDPGIIDQVVEAFHSTAVDYASNTLQRTYPQGLDVEVFRFAALREAAREAREEYQLAHVTPYIYGHQERFRVHNVVAPQDYSQYRLTVDQYEDLECARALYARLGNRDTFTWSEVISVLEVDPDLAALNRDVVQKGLYDL